MNYDDFKIKYESLPIAISENNGSLPTKLHNHTDFEILLVNEGSCTVNIADRKYNAKQNDMIFINPMEVHRIIVNKDAPYMHQCICFDTSVIMNNRVSNNLSNECRSIINYIPADSGHSKNLRELFDGVAGAINRGDKTFSMDISAYITLIFSYLIKNSLVDIEKAEKKQSEFSVTVVEYLKENYGKKLTSRSMADACFLNHSYFCRKFKEHFGTSFSAYLNIYRISMARNMLEKGTKSIAEISEKCGFETPSYFSRCFKNHVGILPNEYKKM